MFRRLEIIGEAANKLDPTITSQYPDIPWRAIVGLRNKLIHEYSGIEPLRIWDLLNNELAELKQVVDSLLQEMQPQNN